MRNSRMLLVLAMIFVALAAMLAAQNMQRGAVTATAEAACTTCVFPGLQLDDIQAIRLRSPETGQTLLLDRDASGTWTAPEASGTLDITEADGIARTMVLLPYSRTLSIAASDDLTTYGFSPEGILSIEIVQSSGFTHAVAVGYRTPTSDGYYALVDDLPDLYLLERAPVDYLISRLINPPIA